MLSSAARRTDRAAAATLALLLQLGFIAAFLHAFVAQPTPRQMQRELTFFLPRLLPKVEAVKTGPSPRAPAASSPVPLFAPPPATPGAPAAASNNAATLQNLGRSLFDCAPENYASRTPQQRAACPRLGEGFAIREAPPLMGLPSQVKDEAHWEEELAREQSPAMLPCMGFVDVLCLLMKIADGSLSDYGDPKTWPHYEVTQLSKGDFYKIEQAYDAWHKAHAGAPGSTEGVSVHPQ